MSTSHAAPHTGKATVTGIDIAAFMTGDPQRAIAFYRDVLGLTPTEIDEQGRGAEFTLADGSTFGVWNPGPEGEAGGCVMMFAVENAAEAVKEFRARGAELSDVDETPVCYMSFGKDPDGNGFMIHQRKRAS
jgi:predicted enzyme related to lactoylglutathione lyase